MHAARIVIGVVFGLLFIWVLGFLAVAARSYFLMFRPRNDTTEQSRAGGLEQGEFDADFLERAWESVRVRSPRGYDLAAFALPAAASSPAAGTVVFVHGFTSTHYSMMKYMRPFSERAWNVVTFDLAGHGDSAVPLSASRSPSFGFYEKVDLDAVIDWAAIRFLGSHPLVLVGESMGAATVLQYAPIGAPLGTDESKWKADAVIADCSFTSAREELFARLAAEKVPAFIAGSAVAVVSSALNRLRGFRPEDAAPAAAIMQSPIPILFIHGGDDKYVPTEMSVRMAEDRKRSGVGATDLLVVPLARHAKSVLVDPETWFRTTFAFIERYATKRTNG